MKITFVLLFLTLSSAYNTGRKVSNGEEDCCEEKEVGDVKYFLFLKDQDTHKYGCTTGCVYTLTGQGGGSQFCFASGNLTVHCDDDEYHWCYNNAQCGPDTWANHTGYEACGASHQSPINVDTASATFSLSVPPLKFAGYENIRGFRLSSEEPDVLDITRDKRLNGQIDNNGHTAVLVVMPKDGDGILSGGPLVGEYKMLQLHFHWGAKDEGGSEHQIDNKSYPMEMHIVHQKKGISLEDALKEPNGLAVTGFMFKVTQPNPSLELLVSALSNIKNASATYNMDSSNLTVSSLLPNDIASAKYASYNGSLTTPPCFEVVKWILFTEPLDISSDQLAKFRELQNSKGEDLVDNFRPVQPLNNRTVTLYT